jgi:cytochrome c oxidase assembly protein subunit 15
MSSASSAPSASPAPAVPSDLLVKFAWGTLAYNVAVILWGAYVRATGSGAGCGSHWPLCNGEMLPRAPSVATMIEFSHRLTSGLALIAVVILLVWTRRATAPGHPARRGAMWSMIFMLTEAGVGAGLVLFQLVADNASMARAMFMAVHLANTFLLLGAITLTAYWLSGGDEIRVAGRGGLAGGLAALATGIILVSVSGAVAALGDTLYPSTSLSSALAADLSASSHLLIRLRVLHPTIAILIGIILMLIAPRLPVATTSSTMSSEVSARLRQGLIGIVALQMGAGFANVILLAPVWMQIVHLLLADAVWIAFVLLAAATLAGHSERSAVSGSTRVARHAGI